MKLSHNIIWITAADLATALAAGRNRNEPSAAIAGQKLDRTTEHPGTRKDHAAAGIKQKAARSGDKLDDVAITAKSRRH